MGGSGDGLDGKTLTSVILDPAKQDQRDCLSLAFYGVQDVCKPESVLSGPRVHFKHGIFGVKSMERSLRREGVLHRKIGGK